MAVGKTTNTEVNPMFASFLINWVKDNMKREEGQAMAEYGIILALIAAIVIGTLVVLGTKVLNALNTVVNAL
ncbi:MAG: Flp family type IVb pilin [Gaiellaceae bacterium]